MADSPVNIPFTWSQLSKILDAALSAHYEFLSFPEAELSIHHSRRVILLRHDIDYDPDHVAAIASIEKLKGVKATYFFQIDSPFYFFDDPATQTAIEQVISNGHWLGLHVDVSTISTDGEAIEKIESQASLLEAETGAKIGAVSFHMPTRRAVSHLRLSKNRINVYAPIFHQDFEYVSDSNQNWRGKDIFQVLSSQNSQRIQLLVHPIWWRKESMSFLEIIGELARKLNISVPEILTKEQLALLNNNE